MAYQSEFGRLTGLRARIDDWMERLSMDKNLPWAGLGLIDDLEAVGRFMDGKRTDTVEAEFAELDL